MTPCPSCGSPMSRGTRYEDARTVDVLICWEDGEELPRLYRRTAYTRNLDAGHPARNPLFFKRRMLQPVLTRRSA